MENTKLSKNRYRLNIQKKDAIPKLNKSFCYKQSIIILIYIYFMVPFYFNLIFQNKNIFLYVTIQFINKIVINFILFITYIF